MMGLLLDPEQGRQRAELASLCICASKIKRPGILWRRKAFLTVGILGEKLRPRLRGGQRPGPPTSPRRRPDLRGLPLSSGGRTVTQTLGAERSSWAAASEPSVGSVWPHTRSRRAPGRSPAVSANVKRSTCVTKPSASTSKPRRPWPSRGSASSRVSQPRLTSWGGAERERTATAPPQPQGRGPRPPGPPHTHPADEGLGLRDR